MERTEWERCTPESVGIPSAAIERLLDALDYGGFTQMHGLMIMRHGKICAEGWWAPFMPELRHCCHSLSKTYTATAVGIARREGILQLDERVIDILRDEAPENPEERLSRLTVRDLLVMGAGMEQEQDRYPRDWLKTLLRTPLEHEPGTHWRYNSHVTSCLAAIVERRSGEAMLDYLTPRLFEKIGIDARHVRCRHAQDGTAIGGGGMFTTTEDNLRLMKLYMDGGVCDGERILDEDFVREATSPQMDTRPAHAHTPWIYDNCVGYGYQIWMCRPEGAYRADGSYGQFSVVVPSADLIVSISESAYLGETMLHSQLHLLPDCVGEDQPVHGPQATLNALFDILLPQLADGPLPPNAQSSHLKERLRRLAVPAPCTGMNLASKELDVTMYAEGEGISFGILHGSARQRNEYPGARRITMRAHDGIMTVSFEEGGEIRAFEAELRGGRRSGTLVYPQEEIATQISVCGWWESGSRLCLSILWIETAMENRFCFSFEGEHVKAREWVEGGVFGAAGERTAVYGLKPGKK